MENYFSRRKFIGTVGATAALTILGGGFESCKKPLIYVRQNVKNLAANSLTMVTYNAAVKAMRLLPPTDPLSWSYQAAIHGTDDMTMPMPAGWNSCQHHNYYFWSWHRMYLYYFEK